MSKECFVCHKSVSSGNAVSHSNRHSKRVWKPNLQKIRILVNGKSQRKNVCTNCIRSGRVERA